MSVTIHPKGTPLPVSRITHYPEAQTPPTSPFKGTMILFGMKPPKADPKEVDKVQPSESDPRIDSEEPR
jgi:hypothetical protein